MKNKTREILIMKANGMQSKQIASELGMHRRGVEWNLKKAVEELSARNVYHAIAKAMKEGVILAGEIGMVLILSLSCFVGNGDIRTPPRAPRVQTRTVRREA